MIPKFSGGTHLVSKDIDRLQSFVLRGATSHLETSKLKHRYVEPRNIKIARKNMVVISGEASADVSFESHLHWKRRSWMMRQTLQMLRQPPEREKK